MTALVMASSESSGVALMVGLMITLAVGVLLPHLGAYRPAKDTVKRILAAALIAGLTATIGSVVVRANDDEFVISCEDRCLAIECWWACLTSRMAK